MNIGEAAKTSGVSAKMIRYYESIGLIVGARRSESGYRFYVDADIHVLSFIRRARDLGFPVGQMRGLLALWRDRSRASADVKAIALEQIAELEAKAKALQEMSQTLRHLADNCHGDDRPDCPIIEDLAEPPAPKAKAMRRPRFGAGGVDPYRTERGVSHEGTMLESADDQKGPK